MTPALPAAPAARPSLRPYRHGLWFGFFNALNWQVALGVPMVLLVEALGGSAFHVGLAYSFFFLMTPVQVAATALLPRLGFKRVMMSGWGLRALFLLPPIALAWLARDGPPPPWMLTVMIVSVFGFAFFRAVGSSAWLPWIYKLLPEGVRGRYFATDQVLSGVASVGVLLACSVLFKVLPLSEAFVAQYGIALVGAALSYYALSRMPDTDRPHTIALAAVVRETPALLVRPGHFRRFLWASCWFQVAVAGLSPFMAFYLKVELGVQPGEILLFTTIQFSGTILVSLLMRGEVDQFGPRPFLFTSALCYGVVAAFWLALLHWRFEGGAFLPFVYLLVGAGSGLWVAGNLAYLPAIVPADHRPLMLSVHGAATAFVGGLSPVLWGLALNRQGPAGAPGMDVGALAFFFAFVLLSFAGLVLWLRRFWFPEQRVEPIELGSLMFRPQRAFSYFINLVDSQLPPAGPRREAEDGRKE